MVNKIIKDLEIGEKIQLKRQILYVVGIGSDRIIVSKKENGFSRFAISIFSGNYDDLFNRIGNKKEASK